MSRYLLHRSIALGAVTALMAAAPATATSYEPQARPSLKENVGRRPKYTTDGIFCRPGERAMTVDHGKDWREVNPISMPSAVPQGELPPGIPQGSVQAATGQWLVPLANGTFAMMGSQTIPDASVSKEGAASELGLSVAATAGAILAEPADDDDAEDAAAVEKLAADKRRAVEDEVNGLTVAKLKEELAAAGVAFEGDANKPQLQAALLGHRLKG